MLTKQYILAILYIKYMYCMVSSMKIIISNSAGIPIYEQIKDQIRAGILSGEIAEGQALPSIRQLARDLRISVITTTRAYGDLAHEGYVANVQGKGCFVLPRNQALVMENALREIEAGLSAAITSAKMAQVTARDLHNMLDILLDQEIKALEEQDHE